MISKLEFRLDKDKHLLLWSLVTMILSIVLLIVLQYNCRIFDVFVSNKFSTITSIIAIFGILIPIVLACQKEITDKMPERKEWTVKLHNFRTIAHILINSYDLWLEGLPQYIQSNYKNLSIFDINTPKTEKAKEFINSSKFNKTKYLFLELKSFMNENKPFDKTIHSEFDNDDIFYSTKILEKWLENYCGNGLWYYFDNKYPVYKSSFNLRGVSRVEQEKIKKLATKIDKNRYENLDFGCELLSQLGTQVESEIIPQLFKIESFIKKKERIIKIIFMILSILIAFSTIIFIMTVNKILR